MQTAQALSCIPQERVGQDQGLQSQLEGKSGLFGCKKVRLRGSARGNKLKHSLQNRSAATISTRSWSLRRCDVLPCLAAFSPVHWSLDLKVQPAPRLTLEGISMAGSLGWLRQTWTGNANEPLTLPTDYQTAGIPELFGLCNVCACVSFGRERNSIKNAPVCLKQQLPKGLLTPFDFFCLTGYIQCNYFSNHFALGSALI